jgi:hypothetical protein
MATPFGGTINDICNQMKTLRNDIASLDKRTNLYAAEDISEQLHRGEGLLESLREPVGVVKATPAGEARDSDDEEEQAKRAKRPVKQVDEDPEKKGKLGEDKALCFLQELESEIVSIALELDVAQRA